MTRSESLHCPRGGTDVVQCLQHIRLRKPGLNTELIWAASLCQACSQRHNFKPPLVEKGWENFIQRKIYRCLCLCSDRNNSHILELFRSRDSSVSIVTELFQLLNSTLSLALDWDSSVGITTHYGLEGPGSNPGGGEIFRTRPERL